MRRWDEEIKNPTRISGTAPSRRTPSRNSTIGVPRLSREGAGQQVEMIYRHHTFTISWIFPSRTSCRSPRWTDLPSGEVLGLLKGAAPVSRGAGTGALERLRAALAAPVLRPTASRPAGAPGDRRSVVEGRGRRAAPGVPRRSRLSPRHGVRPQRQVRARDARNAGQRHLGAARKPIAGRSLRRAAIRYGRRSRRTPDRVRRTARRGAVHPPSARRTGKCRTIRGDGLARRAMLEAGRRLVERGVLPEASLAISGSHERWSTCSRVRRSRPSRAATPRGLARKQDGVGRAAVLGRSRRAAACRLAAQKAQANARAIDAAIRNNFIVPILKAAPKCVAGLPLATRRQRRAGQNHQMVLMISTGCSKGTCLIDRNTFAVVHSRNAAARRDRHLSRWSALTRRPSSRAVNGIPAVVGMLAATNETFADGARARVNGDKGVVELGGE